MTTHPEKTNMSRPTLQNQSAESFVGKTRLESLTLRCGREERRRIEDAYSRECTSRPKLSLSRFLAECVANGLPGNLPLAVSPCTDHDTIALLVTELINERLTGIEAAVPFIADVLQEITQQVATVKTTMGAIQADTSVVREIVEGVISGEPTDGTAENADATERQP